VPGLNSNVPGREIATTDQSGNGKNSNKSDETRNYEISKLVSRTVMPVGAVKRISVAVMVDGKYSGGDKKGEEKTFLPRSESEIAIYTNMVKKAIGFNKKRGDQIEVASIAFNNESLNQEVAELKKSDRYGLIFSGLKYLAMILAGLFFYFKILKPGIGFFIDSLTTEPNEGTAAAGTGKSGGMGHMADQVADKVEIHRPTTVMDQVSSFASENPEEVAKVVKLWLKEQTT